MQSDSVAVTIEVPAALADEETPARAKRLLVLDAARSERLSWRAAAQALAISPEEFLDLARAHGVPVIRQDVADWQQELSTVERLASGRQHE
jgi:hypothetical protein